MPPDDNGHDSMAKQQPPSAALQGKVSLVDIIVSPEKDIRNLSLAIYCRDVSSDDLLEQCQKLDTFYRSCNNLYQRVRALFFLYAIHRFHLTDITSTGTIPYEGYKALLERRFQDAIDVFLNAMKSPSEAISSALAVAYYQLGFATLASQVRQSVKTHPGNHWMFQVTTPSHPKRIAQELLEGRVLCEMTPVRMDLSHCGWSDIFFLGMDFPEGARVLNISVNLAVYGRHDKPAPPIETYVRVIDEPVLKLTSIDLKSSVTLSRISQVFEFGTDYLGLLRAGIIASGIVPPGLENDEDDGTLKDLLQNLIGRPGCGLQLVTRVNDIPKGSRLAVSTTLLGSIIALGMRATGQTASLTAQLTEPERRLVAARAILGEWLGGSGGGWQDSGGVWPGIKIIKGVVPQRNDPEFGISRGRLLPTHEQLTHDQAPTSLRKALQESLVLVHGGMAQNVGPVLEMVTEKYLLREANEWRARQEAMNILDDILRAFAQSNVYDLAKLVTRNFFEPLQTIIPWATNLYTETLIERTGQHFGDRFWGFWMLGGMSGGGMGFIFDPTAKAEALNVMQEIMLKTKQEMQHALPFAMDPVVYDFDINEKGTVGSWFSGNLDELLMKADNSTSCHTSSCSRGSKVQTADELLVELGFDTEQHEQIRQELRQGLIGLAQNRLPVDTEVTDVQPQDVIMVESAVTATMRARGEAELRKGTVGVVTLAAGVGSRWTQGAGCVKAIHPFCKFGGRHRSFVEVHLAKSRRVSVESSGTFLPHVFTTSYMTDGALRDYLEGVDNHNYPGPIYQSHGLSIGRRLIPMIRDLKFAWQECQQLDEQAQKVRDSMQSALVCWAQACGEGSDYDSVNEPHQCLHPVGHWYEIPNLLLNGTLKQMLDDRPQLKTLLLHNIDAVGADVDSGILGLFLEGKTTMAFEVVPRRIEDRGGGLARVDGTPQLVEGLAMPHPEDEFKLSYYNSMTSWIDVDKLLETFGLSRSNLSDSAIVSSAVHKYSKRLPTYVTIKDVKKRWGNGQEDVHPVAQFEKLWGDMSSLTDCQFFVVQRQRGQQLKDPAQLDGWLRDGSASFLESLCEWE